MFKYKNIIQSLDFDTIDNVFFFESSLLNLNTLMHGTIIEKKKNKEMTAATIDSMTKTTISTTIVTKRRMRYGWHTLNA